MNKKEQRRIERLYLLIAAVPFPASGSVTTTISGHTGYSEDSRTFIPAIQGVLKGMMALAGNTGELIEDEDYYDPDELLFAIEKWVKQRNAQAWVGRIADVMSFYKQPPIEAK